MAFFRSCETMAEMRRNDWNWRDSASFAISSRRRSLIALKLSASLRVSAVAPGSMRWLMSPVAIDEAARATRSMSWVARRAIVCSSASAASPEASASPTPKRPERRTGPAAAV